ncbi:MAG: SH3 domain-containing protein [Clostridium sp.]
MIKTFFIYVLLLTSGGLGILYYLLNDKYNKQNIQVRVLTKQNNSLTSQLNTINKPNDSLKIYYHPIKFYTGETLKRCSLYISPLSNSPIIRSISMNTKVEILDAVETLETLWYEIRVITSDNVNTKGFVRQELIKELQVIETHIIKN